MLYSLAEIASSCELFYSLFSSQSYWQRKNTGQLCSERSPIPRGRPFPWQASPSPTMIWASVRGQCATAKAATRSPTCSRGSSIGPRRWVLNPAWVNDRAKIDVPLEIGRAAEQITVVADAPLIEDSTGSLGQVVGGKQITDLPLDGHNPFSLMRTWRRAFPTPAACSS